MEFLSYAGWMINTQEADKGIRAFMTDPSGNVFHQSIINWQSHHSARRYAQKFIDWHNTLNAQYQEQELTSVPKPTQTGGSIN
jgi:hypothetical protein